MDTKALIREAHARFAHNSAKQLLKEKYQAKLIVASQGGLWKVTPELIAFVNDCGTEHLILLDEYENPVKVIKEELLPVLVNTYITVMEEWHNEFQELRHKR
jgi:hypothetical protein